MWHTLQTSPKIRADFGSSVRELLQSTFRNLVLTIGGIYLVWYFATTGSAELSLRFLPLTALLFLTCALSLHQLAKRFLVAQAAWQIGLAGAIALGLYISQQPVLVFFFALLPLMAVVTQGWLSGLLVEGLVIVMVGWITHSPDMPPLPPSHVWGVVVGGALTGLLGWTTTHSLITAVQWSFYGVEQARQNMEEARQHRARLAKVLKDLDLAYQRLEHANSALLVARDAAIAAERFKAEFVANVSHELRTPLNLIIGFSEVMATAPESYDGAPLPRAYRGDVMAIYHSAQHLSDLIDDVLDLSQIEAGRMPLSKEAVKLGEVIQEAAQIMRNLAEARELQFELGLPDSLPVLYIDRTRIRQVLLNLLSNAIRHTDQGWIRVRAFVEGQAVTVIVEDSGPGIPSNRLANAFEVFSQLEDGHSHEGSGLGLALSKKFIELHDGKIWINSELGRGTKVSFTLPLPEGRKTAQVSLSTATSSVLYEGQPSIVVLHDDPRVLSSLRRRSDGYKIRLADTLEKARGLIQELFPTAVIMDEDWANRWQVTGADLNLPALTPLITCPLPSPRSIGRQLGAVDYLPKPVTKEDLQDTFLRLPSPPQTVLVVDDNPRVVRLLARLLKTINAEVRVLEAFSGEEGLEIIRAQRPDVVLLDMVLPDIDGYAVLEKIAEDETMAETQLIITSAHNLQQEEMPIKGELRIGYEGGFSQTGLLQTVQAVLATITSKAAPPSDAVPLEV